MCTTALGHDRPATDIEIRLEADDLAPRKARAFVRHHVERLGYPRCVDDAAVVVSELVTNAVAAAPGTPIFVALPPSSGRLVIEVWDLSPERPVPREPGALDTHGRGLGVVQGLSLTYGCDHRGRWKVVWALLDGR
ncbi:MAG TPA: ATP-binding protein [Streptosporangiaceae bacterium]|nr:ATP-binding protein [Streptosporangiaceae bacterium]